MPDPLLTEDFATRTIGKMRQLDFLPSLMDASAPVDHAHPVFVPFQEIPAAVGTKIGTLPREKIFCAMPTDMLVVTVNGRVEAGSASIAVNAYVPLESTERAYNAVPAISGCAA